MARFMGGSNRVTEAAPVLGLRALQVAAAGYRGGSVPVQLEMEKRSPVKIMERTHEEAGCPRSRPSPLSTSPHPMSDSKNVSITQLVVGFSLP